MLMIYGSNMTLSEKTDHLAEVSDVQILVPYCNALFTLRNSRWHMYRSRVQVWAPEKSFLAETRLICERCVLKFLRILRLLM